MPIDYVQRLAEQNPVKSTNFGYFQQVTTHNPKLHITQPPSGDPSPSRADEAITRRINEASTLLQVRLIDHVIVGEPSPGRQPYFSFRECGLIG
jgi:hypothetical protein